MERKLKKHPLLPWWPVLLIGFGGVGAAGAAARGLSLEEALDLVLAQSAEVRLASAGVELVTTEMVAFEWLRSAEHPAFKAMLQLVK